MAYRRLYKGVIEQLTDEGRECSQEINAKLKPFVRKWSKKGVSMVDLSNLMQQNAHYLCVMEKIGRSFDKKGRKK